MIPSQDPTDKNRDDAQANDSSSQTIQEYISTLLRGKWTILAATAVVLFFTAIYTFTVTPIYEANSLVMINMQAKDGGLPLFDPSGTISANRIANELEVLKSQSTAQNVAEALRSLKYLDEKNKEIIPILLTRDSESDSDSLIIAETEQIRDRILRTAEFMPIRETDVIKITTKSANPKEAALIANVYTEVYTTRNLNASRNRSKAVREFLQQQLQAKKGVLDTTERELQNYMRSSGVVSLDAEGSKTVEQLSQLEAQRDGIEVEISSKQKTLTSYKEELARLQPGSVKEMGESSDSYIRLLQDQIAKLEVQRDIVVAQNPDLVGQDIYSDKLREIDQQIASLKKNLQVRTQQFLGSIMPGSRSSGEGAGSFLAEAKQKIIEQQVELQGLQARKIALDGVIREAEKRFNQLPKKSMEFAKLQRARLSNEKLYLLVEEKYNETAIKEKSQFGYVDVIDPAVVPVKPVSPRVMLNLVVGLLLGLGIGIGIVMVKASLDVSIRTPEDLKRHGFFPLSTICNMDEEIKKITQDVKIQKTASPYNYHLITHYRPMAPISESYRHLRTSIQFLKTGTPVRCFVVTSANPEEGKTTTVCNLAVSLAQSEKKILLVNADLRRSMMQYMFGLKNDKGLTDFLVGSVGLADVLYRQVLPNLDIINSGTVPHNPSEILGSKKMKEFIKLMKEKYDVIIFDTPPLLAVTDASALATETDGVIIVASAGITQSTELKTITEFLKSIGVHIIGVVLNNFDISNASNKYAYGYHYGYYGYESGQYQASTKKRILLKK
ncbi:MAG: polysaccharide biosynthesis tyrosine autokinase [Bacteroidetes bacterium]|nr:polysaccharide biosynthesis tyrosine autokinase [Bacteroidota bacterium]